MIPHRFFILSDLPLLEEDLRLICDPLTMAGKLSGYDQTNDPNTFPLSLLVCQGKVEVEEVRARELETKV
jgi:hypothetical protein